MIPRKADEMFACTIGVGHSTIKLPATTIFIPNCGKCFSEGVCCAAAAS